MAEKHPPDRAAFPAASNPASAAPPPPASEPETDALLHLLVFGRSGSGKSALLAALAGAAREADSALRGQLTSPPGMEQPGRQGQALRASPATSYRIHYNPTGDEEDVDAVLVDSEGLAATELLAQSEVLDEDSPAVPLAQEVMDADTLILTVNAALPQPQLESEFASFKKLLRVFQQRRGLDLDVGGLPVFLVLTHADLLARPNDTFSDWQERLEERKREVDQQFRAALEEGERAAEPEDEEDDEPAGQAPATPEFGWIDLHVWTTATRRPVLRSGNATGAFRVSELFQQCLEEAADYRRDWRTSERRLKGLVLTVLMFGSLLLGLTVTRVATDVDGRTALLTSQVEDLRSTFGSSPEEYLRGTRAELREEEQAFREVRYNPWFGRLSPELRAFVVDRLDELSAYVGYSEKLAVAPTAFDEWTAEGLERLLVRLERGDLTLPRPSWANTPAGIEHQQRWQTAHSLRDGVRQLQRWYVESSADADKLWTFANYPPRPGEDIPRSWVEEAANVLAPEKRLPPWRDQDPLPGSPPGLLTYADAMRFYEVKDARIGWEVDRDRLADLVDLLAALGLVTDLPNRPPLLVFTAARFTWTGARWQGVGTFGLNAAGRLADLKAVYPHFARAFGSTLPDRIAPQVRQKADEQYLILLAPARAEVLRRLREAGPGPTRWSAVARQLGISREMSLWNELALILLRVMHEQPEAPVPALERFLTKDEFPLEFRTATVEIQRFSPVEPNDEPLKVVWQDGKKKKQLVFNRTGKGKVVGGVVQTIYRLAEKATINYRPGQELYAELPLKGLDRVKQRLVWVDSRTSRYQFERLAPGRGSRNGGRERLPPP